MNKNEAELPPKEHLWGGRIGYLDALKCLGIFLMIEGHVRALVMGVKPYDSLSGMMLYSFNMPIFFFVSGFLAYKNSLTHKEIGRRSWQKFVFLVIPAFVFSLFSDLLAQDNPLDVFINKGFGKYWFTFTLFECFVVYYLAHLIFRKETVRHIVLLVMAFAGVGLLSVFQNFGPVILDMNHLTKYFQFFMFGVLAMRYKEKYEKLVMNEGVKSVTLLAFFVLLFLMNYTFWPKLVFHVMRDVVLRYLGTFVVVSFFVCHASWFDRESKGLSMVREIGKKSLAVYLLHYFFIPHLLPLPAWMAELDKVSIPVFSMAYSIIILAASMFFITLLTNSKIVAKYALGQK